MQPNITLAPGLCHNRDVVLNHEWPMTDCIGGYAKGILAATNIHAAPPLFGASCTAQAAACRRSGGGGLRMVVDSWFKNMAQKLL